MPLFVRKLIVDFVETGLAALLALTFVMPASADQAKEVATLIFAAVAGALIAAVRRAAPEFILWLRERLGVPA